MSPPTPKLFPCDIHIIIKGSTFLTVFQGETCDFSLATFSSLSSLSNPSIIPIDGNTFMSRMPVMSSQLWHLHAIYKLHNHHCSTHQNISRNGFLSYPYCHHTRKKQHKFSLGLLLWLPRWPYYGFLHFICHATVRMIF